MSDYESTIRRLCLADLATFRQFCSVDQAYAEAMVAYAQPRALAVLGDQAPPDATDGDLPVTVHVVSAEESSHGQLMPAWPVIEKRPVPIYVLENWGLFLYLLRATVGEPAESTQWVDRLFCDRSRIQVGITNDVVQAFVNYPPPSSYSFVRHHALMLFLAILWLPEPQRSGWLQILDWCSRTLCDECDILGLADPLQWVETVAVDGARILRDHGPTTQTDEGVAAFLADEAVLTSYLPYLGTTSLAVASLSYQYGFSPAAERPSWQTHAANVWHAEPDFNTAWMLAFLETLR